MNESRIKYLGVVVDRELKWKDQVSHVHQKCLASLSTTRMMLFNALVLPHLDFCSSVWHQCGEVLAMRIERIQKYAMRLITSSSLRTSSDGLRSKLSWMSMRDRRCFRILCKVHQCLHKQALQYLCGKFTLNSGRTRSCRDVYLYKARPHTEFCRRPFEYGGGMMWNDLPNRLKGMYNAIIAF